MIWRTYTPGPPLAYFVNKFWLYEGSAPVHAKERVLPDGSAQLIVNLRDDITRVYDRDNTDVCHTFGGCVVSGARSGFAVIDTAEQTSVLGVHFRHGGAFPFLGHPLSELRDLHVSIDVLWGAAGVDLRNRVMEAGTPDAKFRVLERILLARARGCLTRNPAVEFALKQFHNISSVGSTSSVIGQIGMSKRRFIQIFDERVGLTPKLYCRVRRFQDALRLIATGREVEWADLALDCGYFDQAHFIHDFKNFSGLNPLAYLQLKTEHANHARLME